MLQRTLSHLFAKLCSLSYMDICFYSSALPRKWKKKLLATCAAFLTQKTGVLAEVFPDTANKIHNDYTPDFITTTLFTVSCRTHL